jgi:hypothetical protein
MKKSISKLPMILLIVPSILLGGLLQAHDCEGEDCPHNIAVGNREVNAEDRAQLALEREIQIQEGADLKIETDVLTSKSSLFKDFYQLHYAAFHRPIAIAFDGSSLELEDGSIWSIKYTVDRLQALTWSSRDSIVIEQWDLYGKEYKILNQTRDEYVISTPIVGPLYVGTHSHWIKSIDSFGTIKLEDGSEWDTFTRSETALWLPNDTVIVGAYRSGASYNTIFINVNLLNYARVKLNWKR